MGQHQKILQVVGYQNSGKTTLMEQFIKQSVEFGMKVASIKHHGHGGKPDFESTKDSARHERAGATVTAVEGDGTLRLNVQKKEWTLEQIISLYDHFEIDMIFIEGYKKEHYPKIVILQMAEDYELVEQLSNIVCVLYWPTYTGKIPEHYPAFPIDDRQQYIPFLCKEMRVQNANEEV